MPPSAPRRRRGPGGCLRLVIVLVLALVVVVVGGFVAFQSGYLTLDKVLNVVGLGPATIEVDDFRDDAVSVQVQQLEVSSDQAASAQLDLGAFDVRSYRVAGAGKYGVAFTAADGTQLGSCTLSIRSGDDYQFVVLPDQIVVNRANDPATAGADLVVPTSGLCR